MSLRNSRHHYSSSEERYGEFLIDFSKVLNFLFSYLRFLLVGALCGAIFGLFFYFGFQSYEFRLVLPNVFKAEISNYRELMFDFSIRAHEFVKQKSITHADKDRYQIFASQQWWIQHVTPLYAVSKVDLKDRVGLVDHKGSAIYALQVKISEDNESAGIEEIFHIRNFIYSAHAYNQIRNLINSYEKDSLISLAVLDNETNLAEIKLANLKRQIIHLEELKKRYPNVGALHIPPNELGDSVAAKYLPVTAQLIATKSDLFFILENLSEFRERRKQLKLKAQFLSYAKPILMQEQDGFRLITRLLEVVANLRKDISPNELYLISALDSIQVEFLNIQTPLVISFNDPPIPSISSTLSLSKLVALGFFGGGFLALLICLGLYFWPSFKREITKAQQKD